MCDDLAIEIGRRHRECEEAKGFLPPPPLLLREISKLLEIAYHRTVPEAMSLTYARRAVLRSLEIRGVQSQQEIAAFAHLSAPSVSTELASMEEEGLIIREKDPHDGRAFIISMTEKGTAKHAECRAADKTFDGAMIGDMTQDEQKTLSTLLVKVRNTLLTVSERHGEDPSK